MAAWGYGPLDSDQARDWLEDYRDAQRRTLLEALRRPWTKYDRQGRYDVWRAATQELLEFARRDQKDYAKDDELIEQYVRSPLAVARERLTEILDDDSWFELWGSPGPVRKRIKSEVAAIDKILGQIG